MNIKHTNLILSFMAFSILSLYSTGCKQDTTPRIAESSYIPTLQEVDSVQKSNIAGTKIERVDSVFANLARYKIVGFGHYHNNIENYTAFQSCLPRLRKAGFLLLAVELPASYQTTLDSIMDEKTPPEETNKLLQELNADLKKGDEFLTLGASPKVYHPLFSIILDWFKAGGMVVAIDVPYIYDSSAGHNQYDTQFMLNTIRNRSVPLYHQINGIDINLLDDKKDLAIISEVRSAYMAAMLDYYQSKGTKIVSFCGVKHMLLQVRPIKTVSVSIPTISKQYFNSSVYSLYPYFSANSKGFYNGHRWLGNAAYAVPY